MYSESDEQSNLMSCRIHMYSEYNAIQSLKEFRKHRNGVVEIVSFRVKMQNCWCKIHHGFYRVDKVAKANHSDTALLV